MPLIYYKKSAYSSDLDYSIPRVYWDFFADFMEIVQTEQLADILMVSIILLGIGLLIAWQVRDPLGSSLQRCPVRRNRLPLFFPFFQLLVWLVAIALLSVILKKALSGRPESTIQLAQAIAMTAVEAAMAAFFVLTAEFAFVRGLKGFGLRFCTLSKDLFWAAVNLIAVYPVILLALWVTLQTGQWLVGPDFGLEKHQTLEELQHATTAVKCFLVFSTLVIVPVFEELLFRGMIQSTLTAYFVRPWPAIGITSALFALMHPATHVGGIFVLSVCLGYAYEKSGSLLRPIMIHIIFNAISVVAVLFSWTG
jgi:membrane protease YdiL (CAAX protease family)